MQMPYISKSDVREHNTSCSAWIIIHNNVYDVTHWLSKHPGGADVLLQRAGRDATDGFEDVNHSCHARKMLEDYKIGSLPKNERTTFSRCDYTCLRSQPKSTMFPTPKLMDASHCDLTPWMDPESPLVIEASRSCLTCSGAQEGDGQSNWKWLLLALLVLAMAGFTAKKMHSSQS